LYANKKERLSYLFGFSIAELPSYVGFKYAYATKILKSVVLKIKRHAIVNENAKPLQQEMGNYDRGKINSLKNSSEAESIHIIREVAATNLTNPVMAFILCKDSAVMLHLHESLYPGKPPFSALCMWDTGLEVKEMISVVGDELSLPSWV